MSLEEVLRTIDLMLNNEEFHLVHSICCLNHHYYIANLALKTHGD